MFCVFSAFSRVIVSGTTVLCSTRLVLPELFYDVTAFIPFSISTSLNTHFFTLPFKMSEHQGPRTLESPRAPSSLFDPFADPESTSSSSGRSSIQSSSQVPTPIENRDSSRPSLHAEGIVADPDDAIVSLTSQ
jgi:hypothetical protein